MLPIECVVRGYLTGSGWAEYRENGTVCGIRLPAGLENGDRLPAPIFTPAFKAPMGEHDENISFEQTVELVGESARRGAARPVARDLRARRAHRRGARPDPRRHQVRVRPRRGRRHDARRRGAHERLVAVLGCRGLGVGHDPAERMASFDKQIVRDWLAAQLGQDGHPARAARRDRRAHRRPLPRAARAPHVLTGWNAPDAGRVVYAHE